MKESVKNEILDLKERITQVEVGENVNTDGVSIDFTEVKERCGSVKGRWFCVTHNKFFRNNFEKDYHIDDDKTHRLAWNCFECGRIEVP